MSAEPDGQALWEAMNLDGDSPHHTAHNQAWREGHDAGRRRRLALREFDEKPPTWVYGYVHARRMLEL